MNGCSICGTKPALCADKYDKGTYYLCSGCLSERTAENERLVQAIEDLAVDCPQCNDVGYVEGKMCKFCHTNKISRYNIDLMKIQAINGSDRDAAIKVHKECNLKDEG